MNPLALRVLLLEDEASDAEKVERALERGGIASTVRVVPTAEAFARALPEFQPDLILSDHSGERFTALHALAMIRATRPGTPLIVVTGGFNEGTLVEALRAGAEDCIFKDRLERLAPAVRAAISLRQPLSRLTSRQFEVLRLLAEGLTTREIARRLELSVKTVETHRTAIMQRLGIDHLAGLVRYAVRVGMVPPGP